MTDPHDNSTESPQSVLEFWFSDRVRQQWFKATQETDAEIRARFLETWRAAAEGRLDAWEDSAHGALALVIVLDQFPLNMFRNRPESFATEYAARQVTARALERGFDRSLDDAGKAFLYIPFMHSEDVRDQERSVRLYEAAGLQHNLKWARHHYDLIRRFGRFPHRNAILGRQSTPEETAYLESEEAFRG